MRVHSKLICRSAGKVYEKLLVSEIDPGHTLGVIMDLSQVPSPIPCRLFEVDPEGGQRAYVAVCEIGPVREARYCIAEVNEEGEVFSTCVQTVNFEQAKWRSRLNYRINRSECYAIRECDQAEPYGKTELTITQVIPAPTHIIFRGMFRLPPSESADVRIACINERIEVIASDYIPMGDRTGLYDGTSQAFSERRFSIRVPWNSGSVTFVAWDALRPGLISMERVNSERCDALVAQATGELYNNAGVDPYYPEWFSRQRPTPYELDAQRNTVLPEVPRFSLVVPLFRTPAKLFVEMLDSVLAQSYQNWELVLVNASPEDAELGRLAAAAEKNDDRVKLVTLTENLGISENTNAGIAVSTGDFVGFFDHDDVIEPNLLFEYARAINERPETDVLYCDEDKIDEAGNLSSPFFKDSFNIDELRCYNVVCHLLAIRRSLLDKLEPNSAEFDGAQDHNLTLQASEHARLVTHVPRMLYHWRVTATSTAGNADSKPYATAAGLRAVSRHLSRMGLNAEVSRGRYPFKYVVNYLPPADKPLVSIIIPTSDHAEVLKTCVRSIIQKTTWDNYEIVLVDNNSSESATEAYYEQVRSQHPDRVRVERYAGPFNFSAIVNYGAKQARGEYLLLLNNDTEVITPEWLDRMVGICAREDVGACGVRLFYPDDTIQHAGVCVTGMGAGHLFLNYPRENHGYFNLADCQRSLSAVTAACMMVRRDVFERLGGFDEQFAVAYNDVDFCLRLRSEGLLVIYTPEVELYHYESLSRGEENNPEKRRRYFREWTALQSRWSDFYAGGDPAYTPQLQDTLPNCCYYRF